MQARARLASVQRQLASQVRFLSATTHRMSQTTPLTIESTYRMSSGYEIPILGYGVYQTPSNVASSFVQHALGILYTRQV